jgi:hypothetical protein
MATINYWLGNGYSCSCCGRWDHDVFSFDDENEAIAECVQLAAGNDFDFGIDEIFDYEDAHELQQKIEAAIVEAEKAKEKRLKIDQLKSNIANAENWFATLDQTKASRQSKLEQYRAELAELTQ